MSWVTTQLWLLRSIWDPDVFHHTTYLMTLYAPDAFCAGIALLLVLQSGWATYLKVKAAQLARYVVLPWLGEKQRVVAVNLALYLLDHRNPIGLTVLLGPWVLVLLKYLEMHMLYYSPAPSSPLSPSTIPASFVATAVYIITTLLFSLSTGSVGFFMGFFELGSGSSSTKLSNSFFSTAARVLLCCTWAVDHCHSPLLHGQTNVFQYLAILIFYFPFTVLFGFFTFTFWLVIFDRFVALTKEYFSTSTPSHRSQSANKQASHNSRGIHTVTLWQNVEIVCYVLANFGCLCFTTAAQQLKVGPFLLHEIRDGGHFRQMGLALPIWAAVIGIPFVAFTWSLLKLRTALRAAMLLACEVKFTDIAINRNKNKPLVDFISKRLPDLLLMLKETYNYTMAGREDGQDDDDIDDDIDEGDDSESASSDSDEEEGEREGKKTSKKRSNEGEKGKKNPKTGRYGDKNEKEKRPDKPRSRTHVARRLAKAYFDGRAALRRGLRIDVLIGMYLVNRNHKLLSFGPWRPFSNLFWRGKCAIKALGRDLASVTIADFGARDLVDGEGWGQPMRVPITFAIDPWAFSSLPTALTQSDLRFEVATPLGPPLSLDILQMVKQSLTRTPSLPGQRSNRVNNGDGGRGGGGGGEILSQAQRAEREAVRAAEQALLAQLPPLLPPPLPSPPSASPSHYPPIQNQIQNNNQEEEKNNDEDNNNNKRPRNLPRALWEKQRDDEDSPLKKAERLSVKLKTVSDDVQREAPPRVSRAIETVKKYFRHVTESGDWDIAIVDLLARESGTEDLQRAVYILCSERHREVAVVVLKAWCLEELATISHSLHTTPKIPAALWWYGVVYMIATFIEWQVSPANEENNP